MSRPTTLPSVSMTEPSFSEMKLSIDRDKLLSLSCSNRFLNKSLASPLDELIQSTRCLRLPRAHTDSLEVDAEMDPGSNQTSTTSTTLTGGDPFFGESLMSVSYSYARHCPAGGEKKHGFYDSSLETSFFRGLSCSLGENYDSLFIELLRDYFGRRNADRRVDGNDQTQSEQITHHDFYLHC